VLRVGPQQVVGVLRLVSSRDARKFCGNSPEFDACVMRDGVFADLHEALHAPSLVMTGEQPIVAGADEGMFLDFGRHDVGDGATGDDAWSSCYSPSIEKKGAGDWATP